MTTSHRMIVAGGASSEGSYVEGAVDNYHVRVISAYHIDVLHHGTPVTDPGSDAIEVVKGHVTLHVGASGTATSHHLLAKGQPHQDYVEDVTPSVVVVYGLSVGPAAGIIEVGSSQDGITVQPGAITVGRIFRPVGDGTFEPTFIYSPKTPGDASVWVPRLIYEYRTVASDWLPVPEPR